MEKKIVKTEESPLKIYDRFRNMNNSADIF